MRNSLLPRPLQEGHSILPQRRIELDAEVLCRYDRSRRNHSLLSQRKLVSDADVVVATPAAGGPFYFAAAKIRIGCRTRCCHASCRRAILFCATKIGIGCGRSLSRRSLQAVHSSLRQRRLDSDAEDLCRYASCRRAILLCCYENWKQTQNAVETTNSAGETLHRFPSLSLKSRITARWRTFPGKTLQ